MCIRDSGGFDPSFFMYFEEVDLAFRMLKAGWETHFSPDARITHFGGASTRYQRRAMYAQYHRAALQFYERHRTPRETARAAQMFRFALRSKLAIGAARRLMTTDADRRRAISEFMADCMVVLD